MQPKLSDLTDEQLQMIIDLTDSRVLSLSKDDLRMSEKQLFWNPELEKEVVDYWTELNDWWDRKKIPPCTCADHEGGFMAREDYNPFFYAGEPCSLKWYEESKRGTVKAGV